MKKHVQKMRILIFSLLFIAFVTLQVTAYTTEVHVTKLAADSLTIINERTVSYQWMRDNLPVLGDGTTHYYLQGPVFVDNPDPIVEEQLRWNPEENTNVLEKDMGAVKGTNLKDLCALVGGMSPGEEVKVKAIDGWNMKFAYANVYSPPARTGPMVITWEKNGMYPDTGYTDGMRLIFLADDSVNTLGPGGTGVHAFGNYDWHESAAPQYWYYFHQGDEKYPTTTGLSGYTISDLIIYSNDPVPPPVADFSANIKTGHIVNGNFETGTLTPWTGSGATIYTGTSSYLKHGTASVKLAAPLSSTAWISQNVDLTGVASINFYRYMYGGTGYYLQVYVDTTQVANFAETSTVGGTQTIDLSSYGFSGTHTIKFNAVNTQTFGTFTIYLDDIGDYGPGSTGPSPLTVQFKDLSTKMEDPAHTSWAWDFDNNGVTDSAEKNPLYTYTADGRYTVKLTVTNAGGSDIETKPEYIIVTGTPTIDIDTTGGISSWPFVPGTNENTTSVDLSITTTASNWHVSVKDALDGGKPIGTAGKMAEYTGTSYVSGGKVLANALQVKSGTGSYVTLSGSDQTVQTGISSGTFNYDVGLKQVIAGGDPALTGPNVYRVVITFTGSTD